MPRLRQVGKDAGASLGADRLQDAVRRARSRRRAGHARPARRATGGRSSRSCPTSSTTRSRASSSIAANRKLDPKYRELGQTRAGWARGSQFVYSQHCKAARGVGLAGREDRGHPALAGRDCYSDVERALLAYTDALVLQGGRVADGVFDALKTHLSDEEILEFTYVTALYDFHAVISKALRLEYDDVPDPHRRSRGAHRRERRRDAHGRPLMAQFDSGGVTIAYDHFPGEGRPVSWSTASPRTGTRTGGAWAGTAPSSASASRSSALDCRGHGESAKPHDPAAYTREAMVGDIVRAARPSGRRSVPISSAIRWARASRSPRRWRRQNAFRSLVLGGIGGKLFEPRSPGNPMAEAMEAADPDTISNDMLRSFRRFADEQGEDRLALAALTRASDPPFTRDEVATLSVPALVVAGSRDDLAGDPHELAAFIPGARAVALARLRPLLRHPARAVQGGGVRFSGWGAGVTSNLPLVGRSKNAKHFSGGRGPGTAPPPEKPSRFARRFFDLPRGS